MIRPEGISIVIPVLNGRRALPAVLDAIVAECRERPFEILAVDDGSTDGSARYLREARARLPLRLLIGDGLGPAAAMNSAIREAAYPFICQIDQDVIVHSRWVDVLMEALADPDVAAAQGRYMTRPGAGFWARVMGLDLEQRYARIRSPFVDHVCTGNTIYRASALHQTGLFDETFGYAADNDLSYRLTASGFRLAFRPAATSTHLWRERPRDYLKQQYGVGYGRLDLIRKHPARMGGDDVSGGGMMLHAAGMSAALVIALAGTALAVAGLRWDLAALTALLLVGSLAVERAIAAAAAWRQSGDPAALGFPVAHLLRDAAWACAVLVWSARAIRRRPHPSGSMPRPRPGTTRTSCRWPKAPGARALVIIPAHNEGRSIARVIRDVVRAQPGLDVLVVDDGSVDGTVEAAAAEGARWVTLPLRTGVGGAVRTGILYAVRHGYQYAIRIDGDGQHRACDIGPLLATALRTGADAVVGSRYAGRRDRRRQAVTKLLLAVWLSAITGRRITDPTSGFWVFGPRALELLRRHHPTGYPEPELALLLHRHALRVEEARIRVRPRHAGRTTLTWPRTGLALARTLLALVIVPLRSTDHAEDPR